MRERCVPQPDTLAHKQFVFQPPDPEWAPVEAVRRAREVLREYDPFLNLWWSPAVRLFDPVKPGRWTVKVWMPTAGNWDTVLIWESPSGEYRGEFPEDALRAELGKRDLDKMNLTLAQFVGNMDEANAQMEFLRDKDIYHRSLRHAADKALYDRDPFAAHRSAKFNRAKFGVAMPGHRNPKLRRGPRERLILPD